jgi:hypothetical protein
VTSNLRREDSNLHLRPSANRAALPLELRRIPTGTLAISPLSSTTSIRSSDRQGLSRMPATRTYYFSTFRFRTKLEGLLPPLPISVAFSSPAAVALPQHEVGLALDLHEAVVVPAMLIDQTVELAIPLHDCPHCHEHVSFECGAPEISTSTALTIAPSFVHRRRRSLQAIIARCSQEPNSLTFL